jgi:hypothetical protein
MKPEGLEYGFRSRSSGKLVRLEERHSGSVDYGIGHEGERYLTFDESYPFLQEDDLRAIVNFRHGDVLHGRRPEEFLVPSAIDVADLDIIEFSTSTEASDHGDPLKYTVEISRLDFDFVQDVIYQYPPQRGEGAQALSRIFNKAEMESMADVPWLELVTLKSKVIDVARAGLAGKIIVPDRKVRPLTHSGPRGVVDVRSIDGVTYAAVTSHVWHPRFHKTVSLSDGAELHDQPWDDLKVAFGFDDEDERSVELLEEIWDAGFGGESIWPDGWSMDETDRSGARMVVVFRIEGPLREGDGRQVRSMLRDISALRDPRDGASMAPVPGRR